MLNEVSRRSMSPYCRLHGALCRGGPGARDASGDANPCVNALDLLARPGIEDLYPFPRGSLDVCSVNLLSPFLGADVR